MKNKHQQEYKNEIREQLNNMTFKQRLSYFWDYYKVHTIAVLTFLILTTIFVRDLMVQKNVMMNAIFLNAGQLLDEEAISSDFVSYAGIDGGKNTIYVDTSSYLDTEFLDASVMATIQRISAMSFAGELDILAGDTKAINYYSDNEFLGNPEQILPVNLQEKFQDRFFYADFTNEESGETLSHPIAIDISDSPKLKEWGIYTDSPCYLGFLPNSPHPETAITFLEYLYSE